MSGWSHTMWWKLTLATLIGVIVGIAATVAPFYLFRAAVGDIRAEYVPKQWSSADKEWPAFADWLRHGGRKLIIDAAFSTAKDGMSEAEVRAIFGPPDFVVVGADEFKAYSVAQVRGAGGAYFYKVGRFAQITNVLTSEAFTIVFDPAGKIMYRLGFGVNDGDKLADIDSDAQRTPDCSLSDFSRPNPSAAETRRDIAGSHPRDRSRAWQGCERPHCRRRS
jgi:hypothetical protein